MRKARKKSSQGMGEPSNHNDLENVRSLDISLARAELENCFLAHLEASAIVTSPSPTQYRALHPLPPTPNTGLRPTLENIRRNVSRSSHNSPPTQISRSVITSSPPSTTRANSPYTQKSHTHTHQITEMNPSRTPPQHSQTSEKEKQEALYISNKKKVKGKRIGMHRQSFEYIYNSQGDKC